MSLIVENLGKTVDGEVHLADIDLAFEKGGFYVLLGPTLSGKTSLLRLLAGLDRPTSGRILLDGRDTVGTPVWKRRVSMVYQQFINYPNLTIYDNIAFPLRRMGLSPSEVDAKVRGAAEMLGISELLDRKPGGISGGQQQRTALARSLVKGSDLLLLDEPLINLDYKLREQLRDEFKNIFSDNLDSIVVYSTTEPVEALMLGGEVVVLDEGRQLQTGPTHAVFRRPATETVARVFNDPPMNMIDGAVAADHLLLGGGLRLPRVAHLAELAPGAYRFGIRASDLGLARGGADDVAFDITVELAEISGSETFIHARHADVSWVIQEEGVHTHALGEVIPAYLSPRNLYAFAPDGRLAAAPAPAASI